MVQLLLPNAIHEQIVAHAQACLPFEACGLIAGDFLTDRRGEVRWFYPVTNEARSATTFRLAGVEHLQAELAAEEAGLSIIGVMHSHPTTPAELSPTDRADAARYDPNGEYVHIVVSLAEQSPTLGGFRLRDGAVSEVALIPE